MNEGLAALLATVVLAGVHVGAGSHRMTDRRWHPSALSAGAGVSVAYVFLELMPALAEHQATVERTGLLGGMERHVYVLALVGLTVAFGVEASSRRSRRERTASEGVAQASTRTFALSMAAFVVFNLAVGYALGSPGDETVQPLWIFVVAMGLHFVASDHSLTENHRDRFRSVGRWLLPAALLVGWGLSVSPAPEVPPEALALVLAYIAGMAVMNILHHELPDTDRRTDVVAFVVGAATYGVLVVAVAPAVS